MQAGREGIVDRHLQPRGHGVVQFAIRRAVPADAANVRALTRAAYARWVLVIGREPWPMTADYGRAIAEHMIENIAVRPDRQGEGLGDMLLGHAETEAHALGFGEIRLYTNAAFASNISFYEKRGYREVRRATMVPGSITVFMARQPG